tara:strand:- start:4185 stop:6122 length:1938 start_codon:yes stop_codon:yes gene_type:complete
MANKLPLVEVDYYNSIWNKRILTPQPSRQTGTVDIVKGGAGSAASLGTWPLNNVFAPPLTFVPDFYVDGSDVVGADDSVSAYNFFIEEMYIRGGFNNSSMSYGVRAYLDEEEPIQQHRFNTLIYSGIFNSRTGINRTNEFPVGTNLTRSANPEYGSIQKIFADENDVTVLQENKCSRALIDKNAIYNAEGGGSVTTQAQVLGEIIPYAGEFGISKNPESLAVYAFRKYFVDRNRNAVLRLSGNGITEISEYGMRDFFRDNLSTMNDDYVNEFTQDLNITQIISSQGNNLSYFNILSSPEVNKASVIPGAKIFSGVYNSATSTTTWTDTTATVLTSGLVGSDKVIFTSKILNSSFMNAGTNGRLKLVTNYRSRAYGGWDAYNNQYVVSLQYNKSRTYNSTNLGSSQLPQRDTTYHTLGFDDQVKGWPTFYSYMPVLLGSLKSNFLTVNNQPYAPEVYSGNPTQLLGLYTHYAISSSSGTFYNTENKSTVSIVANSQPSLQKNFLTIDYEGDSGWQATVVTSDQTGRNINRTTNGVLSGGFSFSNDSANIVKSFIEGSYDAAGNVGTAANPQNAPLLHAGFGRKENKYVANFINKSPQAPGEIIFGSSMSGLKGYYLDITFSTDSSTDPGGPKELYAIGLNYSVSSN